MHDVLITTPASKRSYLPDIIFEHQRIRLGRDNISILLGALGKLARGGYDHVLNFLTAKDLAKISMAKLTVTSTFTPLNRELAEYYTRALPNIRHRLIEQQDNRQASTPLANT